MLKKPKNHNPIAKELQKALYRKRVIKDKKKEASRNGCRSAKVD